MHLPTMTTPRLHLMPLHSKHGSRLAELGDDPLVAAYTAGMPSPYTLAAALDFIERSVLAAERKEDVVLGIFLHEEELIGVINLRPSARHQSGHLGYWMGAPYRNQGYTTEAVRLVIEFAFDSLKLHRVQTACMAVNGASARVLEKAGLLQEGVSKQAFFKEGVFHDLLQFGVIGQDWRLS
ncbi:GNAT family N-acetyltransferase [Pseudomonas sp. GV071]|uniref:GNAT family N-acetyltransferase n=1 Tax=Pseudomonas sp. GV071 TaxID=2135754 RepID=UPI000D3C77D4|nr:GNAT family protein [Pseudomonas sp. GV071]PTQ68189.1 RimJ/RimL family protein N-acetyltransferase [Pseudomonas sp. GV071]